MPAGAATVLVGIEVAMEATLEAIVDLATEATEAMLDATTMATDTAQTAPDTEATAAAFLPKVSDEVVTRIETVDTEVSDAPCDKM